MNQVVHQQIIDQTLAAFLIKDVKLLVVNHFIPCNKCLVPVYSFTRECIIDECNEQICTYCWDLEDNVCDDCVYYACQKHLKTKCTSTESTRCAGFTKHICLSHIKQAMKCRVCDEQICGDFKSSRCSKAMLRCRDEYQCTTWCG